MEVNMCLGGSFCMEDHEHVQGSRQKTDRNRDFAERNC
jgi:hypothetical protein